LDYYDKIKGPWKNDKYVSFILKKTEKYSQKLFNLDAGENLDKYKNIFKKLDNLYNRYDSFKNVNKDKDIGVPNDDIFDNTLEYGKELKK
jgi:hypothetical protein